MSPTTKQYAEACGLLEASNEATIEKLKNLRRMAESGVFGEDTVGFMLRRLDAICRELERSERQAEAFIHTPPSTRPSTP
ncbi:MAG: hypothetical protein AB2L09_03990 [Coriobacteriia bacterium]